MTSEARTYTYAWAACDISTHAAYWSRVDLSYTKWRHFSKENIISKRYKFPLFGHPGHNRIYYNSYEIRSIFNILQAKIVSCVTVSTNITHSAVRRGLEEGWALGCC